MRELIRIFCIVSGQSRDTMAKAVLFWSESFDMVTHRTVALGMSDFHGSVRYVCLVRNDKTNKKVEIASHNRYELSSL